MSISSSLLPWRREWFGGEADTIHDLFRHRWTIYVYLWHKPYPSPPAHFPTQDLILPSGFSSLHPFQTYTSSWKTCPHMSCPSKISSPSWLMVMRHFAVYLVMCMKEGEKRNSPHQENSHRFHYLSILLRSIVIYVVSRAVWDNYIWTTHNMPIIFVAPSYLLYNTDACKQTPSAFDPVWIFKGRPWSKGKDPYGYRR